MLISGALSVSIQRLAIPIRHQWPIGVRPGNVVQSAGEKLLLAHQVVPEGLDAEEIGAFASSHSSTNWDAPSSRTLHWTRKITSHALVRHINSALIPRLPKESRGWMTIMRMIIALDGMLPALLRGNGKNVNFFEKYHSAVGSLTKIRRRQFSRNVHPEPARPSVFRIVRGIDKPHRRAIFDPNTGHRPIDNSSVVGVE